MTTGRESGDELLRGFIYFFGSLVRILLLLLDATCTLEFM